MKYFRFVYTNPKLWASIFVIVTVLGMYLSVMFAINKNMKITLEEKFKLEKDIKDYRDSLYLTVKACNIDKQEFKDLYYKSKKEVEMLRAENSQLKFQLHDSNKANLSLKRKNRSLETEIKGE